MTPPPRARVLHVLKHFRPTFTGMGIFVERVTPVMDMLAPEVEHDMLATDTPRPDHLIPAASTLRRVIYLTRDAAGMPHWRREAALLWWLLRNISRYRVVHFHTHVDRYFLAYLLAKLAGKRIVLSATLDDSIPGLLATYRAANRPLVARLFRLFDAYIALSPKLQEENESAVPHDAAHMVSMGIVIPEAMKRDRERIRAAYGIAPEDTLLIFVGGICDRKDPLFLVEQLPAVLRFCPRAKLLVVGPVLEPDHHRRMLDTILLHGLERHVIFAGEVRNPYPLFEAADIMTFASHLEGFGAVVIEGMAHGIPVVVRHLPGINDSFVRPDETGYLFTTAEEYVAALRRLVEDGALRRRLGAAGRRFAIAHFDFLGIAKRYLGIYGLAPMPDAVPVDPGSPDDPVPPLERTLATLPAAASIVDARFRTPAPLPPAEPPLLITTIDAEEGFDWSQPFSRAAVDVSSMAHQHLAHAVFERYGVVPTYLIDHPVASQDAGRGPLLDFLRDRRCEVGTQLHPWVSPPFEEEIGVRNSFAGNLPLALEYEKLRILTEAIEDGLGVRPLVYRAGRYGVGRRTADMLKRLGYLVDTSVVPQRSFADEGGPVFFGFPADPYWVDAERTLLELPLSSALAGKAARQAAKAAPLLFAHQGVRAVLPALLARSGLVERIKLSPEGFTLDDAKKLVRTLLARGTRVFTMSYHSPSLVPGSTPYVRSRADLDRFLAWLDAFYDFFITEIGGRPATCTSVYRLAAAAAHPQLAGAATPTTAPTMPERPDAAAALVPAGR